MNARARYTEIAPSTELSPFIECFWTIRSERPLDRVQPNRVVPDGCTDVIIDFGRSSRRSGGRPEVHDRSDRGEPRAFFVGAMLRPIVVPIIGAVDLLGVRFRPGVAGALLPMPASELTNVRADVDDVLAGRPAWQIAEIVGNAADAGARVAAFERLLREWLQAGAPPPPAVRAAVGLIDGTRGAITVRELERRIGLSARQLQRLFARYAGLSPKAACRVVRFRSAWLRLHEPEPIPLAALAFRSGYADQAHMTREFTEFAGLPPGRYLEQRARESRS